MRLPLQTVIVIVAITWSANGFSAAGSPDVRGHADQSLGRLDRHSDQEGAVASGRATPGALERKNDDYPSEEYWIGRGQGDLAKGRIVCQRVSELSARTDLAKQIRVMVKEHMVDRVRERTGREPEQDIELTREEIVQEYLLGVQIVDRQIDEDRKVCTATAVMRKPRVQPTQPSDRDAPPPSSR